MGELVVGQTISSMPDRFGMLGALVALAFFSCTRLSYPTATFLIRISDAPFDGWSSGSEGDAAYIDISSYSASIVGPNFSSVVSFSGVFCEFLNNSGPLLLLFYEAVVTSIRGIAARSNSNTGSNPWPGLFFGRSSRPDFGQRHCDTALSKIPHVHGEHLSSAELVRLQRNG
jgi:hypothetical protein